MCFRIWRILRGGADKYLVWPERKQAIANKFGFNSTYSPRSSIHFLPRCSNFFKPLKKKIRMFSVQPGLRGSTDLRVGRKMATFQLSFQSREQVVFRWGQIWRIVWVIKTLELRVSGGPGYCRARTTPPWWTSRGVFLQLHQQRWVILRVDSLALWKIINEEDAVLIPKNQGEKFSSGFLHSESFGGKVSRYVAAPLIVALSPGHSNITRFRPWSTIAPDTKSFGSRRKKSQICSDDWHRWRFWSAFRHFGTHSAESFPMSKSSWMMEQPAHVRCPVAQLLIEPKSVGLRRLAREFHK